MLPARPTPLPSIVDNITPHKESPMTYVGTLMVRVLEARNLVSRLNKSKTLM
jgi:hypothetical protein